MLYTIIVAIIVVAISAALWLRNMRSVDRVSLICRTLSKLKLLPWVMKRPPLVKIRLSNGFETLAPGDAVKDTLEEVLNFKMRPDDVLIATYTKSGTTWMQEIVWLICNNADVEAAKRKRLLLRYGFLEFPEVDERMGNGIQSLEKWPQNQRRFMKSHLPFQLLPLELQKNGVGKLICVVRNPKDNCVSLFHFHRMVISIPSPGTWSEFLRKFCNGDIFYGSWFDHVHKYWEVYQQRKDSTYFVSYESLQKDLKGEVIKVARFLGKELSEDQIDAIVQHCSFSNMKNNPNTDYSEVDESGLMNFKVSKFMRKGLVGDWKNYFTINENKAFDEMFAKRTKEWTLKFEFDITD